MRHTLKAVFDHRSDAQHVLNELLASGYSRANTSLSSVLSAEHADRDATRSEDANTFSGSIEHFAVKLFGGSLQKHEATYSGVSMDRRHVVTLAADSEPDVARAIGIIERSGPVDIEDREDEPDYDNVGMGATGTATDGSENGRVYPPGTEPGFLQNRDHEDNLYFGTQRADAPPTGNTFKETMGTGSRWGHPSDDGLQVPNPTWWVNPGGVSRSAESPAYRYGTEMRGTDKYRNRSWNEAEPDLKRDWEMLASDTPPWDTSKAAIRRGWDAITPEIDDDSYYREHWTTRYANSDGDGDYDYYESADIHGSEARRSEKYRSRDRMGVESRLAAERQTRHAGRLSSWGNFKDAVKHGRHGISPDMDGKDAAHPAHGPRLARDDGIGDDIVAVDWTEEAERRQAGRPLPVWDRVRTAIRHGWDRVIS